jgi:hypothetical protein
MEFADRHVPDPAGSIRGSLTYLRFQSWWDGFRAQRRHVALLDDVIWAGQLCRWLAQRGLTVDSCSDADICAYLASLDGFRPGPRAACERTVRSLMDFLRDAQAPEAA